MTLEENLLWKVYEMLCLYDFWTLLHLSPAANAQWSNLKWKKLHHSLPSFVRQSFPSCNLVLTFFCSFMISNKGGLNSPGTSVSDQKTEKRAFLWEIRQAEQWFNANIFWCFFFFPHTHQYILSVAFLMALCTKSCFLMISTHFLPLTATRALSKCKTS